MVFVLPFEIFMCTVMPLPEKREKFLSPKRYCNSQQSGLIESSNYFPHMFYLSNR